MSWGRALGMPLHLTSLLFVVLVTVLVVLALRNVTSNPVVAILLVLMALSWLNKYAFALLDHAANGRREAPVASVEMLGPFGDARALVLPALAFVLGVLAWRVGSPGDMAVAAAAALLLPASVASIAMSGRLADALDPRALWHAIRGLGPWYALLVAACVLVALLSWTLLRNPLAAPVAVALGALAFLELYALLGALLFQRRNELGFVPELAPERAAERAEAERQRRRQAVLDEFYGAIRAREAVRAGKSLEGWLAQGTATQRVDDVRFFIEHAATWPEGLRTLLHTVVTDALRRREPALALLAVEAGLARVPGFVLTDGAEVEAVALAARLASRRRLAADLIDRFARTPAGRPLPPSLALLRAELPTAPP